MTIHNIILRKTLAWLNNGLRDTKVPTKQMKLCTVQLKQNKFLVIQELCDQEATMDMVKEKLKDEHDDKWGESDSIETSETMNHMMKEKKRSSPKRLTSWTMNSKQMIFMEKKTYHLCNKCESKKRLMIMIQQQLKTEMGSGMWTLLRRKVVSWSDGDGSHEFKRIWCK